MLTVDIYVYLPRIISFLAFRFSLIILNDQLLNASDNFYKFFVLFIANFPILNSNLTEKKTKVT